MFGHRLFGQRKPVETMPRVRVGSHVVPAPPARPIESDEDTGPDLLTTIIAAEVASELLSNGPAVDTPADPTPDPPDFGGFGGGDSGGGGASGDF
jgi:hypothetical protein